MNVDLEVALVGLSGVIVGGVITGGVGWAMERRKERREVRRAARLIDTELLHADVAIRMCMDEKQWWSKSSPLVSDAWKEHQSVIAASGMSSADWNALIVAVMTAEDMQEARDLEITIQRAEWMRDQPDVVAAAEHLNIDIANPAPAVPDDHPIVARLLTNLQRVQAGRAVLAPLMKD